MKIIGYLLAIIGIAGLAVAMIPELSTFVPIPEEFGGTTLMIASLVVAVVGIFIIMKSGGGRSGGKRVEVPIFQGKEIVGYRRT